MEDVIKPLSKPDTYTIFPIPIPSSDSDLTKFSTLRLLALRTDPSLFGSTYARELAFTPEVWRSRLDLDGRVTFVVSDEERRGEWIGTMSLLGPDALKDIPHDIPKEILRRGDLFNLVGLWVHPDHRGRGLGSRLVRAGFNYVEKYSRGSMEDIPMDNRLCAAPINEEQSRVAPDGDRKARLVVLKVSKDNEGARALYVKEGFLEWENGDAAWMTRTVS
ncbi:hypothetical protein JAAARDRAFT_30721 [Jaapia argillacea MUCL 33604]|uniref:N-acetyltransferase domain-containing protein n=1 Tax=Jaapia argillacea MUCL 33604 TaxID=933084 RepID=A0A067QJM0_9AGAM|nr:hypothetical protein JAAARDRAFT_30721 [Jaapia argillacea MUCL 33604]